MNFSQQELESFIDVRYIKRGFDIVKERNIVLDIINSEKITAFAIGTGIYQITLFRSQSSRLNGRCNCPAFFDHGPCKHIAAAGLAYLQPGYTPDDCSWEQINSLKKVKKNLDQKAQSDLVDIILNILAYDQDFLEYIESELFQ